MGHTKLVIDVLREGFKIITRLCNSKWKPSRWIKELDYVHWQKWWGWLSAGKCMVSGASCAPWVLHEHSTSKAELCSVQTPRNLPQPSDPKSAAGDTNSFSRIRRERIQFFWKRCWIPIANYQKKGESLRKFQQSLLVPTVRFFAPIRATNKEKGASKSQTISTTVMC
jgi:hypothetical protein